MKSCRFFTSIIFIFCCTIFSCPLDVSAQPTCTIIFIAANSSDQGASSENLFIEEQGQTLTEEFSNGTIPSDFHQLLLEALEAQEAQEANAAEAVVAESTSEGTILSSSFDSEEPEVTLGAQANLFESELNLIGEEDSSENQSETIENPLPNNFTADVQVLTTGAENATSWSFSHGNDQIFYIEYSGDICNCWIQLYQDAYNTGQDIILHVDYNQTRDGPSGRGLDLRDYTDAYPNCTEFNWSDQVSSYNIYCYNLS